jgi:hypothetical protein
MIEALVWTLSPASFYVVLVNHIAAQTYWADTADTTGKNYARYNKAMFMQLDASQIRAVETGNHHMPVITWTTIFYCEFRIIAVWESHIKYYIPHINSNYFVAYLASLSVSHFIHSSMPLQPFVGPWPLQFRNLFFFTQSVGLLGQVISPSQGLYLHTGQHKRTHKHPCFGWDSVPRSQRSSERRQFMP